MDEEAVSLPLRHKGTKAKSPTESVALGSGKVHVSVLRQTNGQRETRTERRGKPWSDMKPFEVVDILH